MPVNGDKRNNAYASRDASAKHNGQSRISDWSLESLLQEWPEAQRVAAADLIQRYGLPHEAMADCLVWYRNGIWNCSELRRSGTLHRFPTPHMEFLKQTFSYRVPPERAGDVIRFNGSILIDRSRGEVTVRADCEPVNILALNLLHEVVTEQRSVAEARNKFAEQVAEFLMDGAAPYSRSLRFEIPSGETADVDEPLITDELLRELGTNGNCGLFTGDHRGS